MLVLGGVMTISNKETNFAWRHLKLKFVSGALELLQVLLYSIHEITVINTFGLRRIRICKVVRRSTVQIGEQAHRSHRPDGPEYAHFRGQ